MLGRRIDHLEVLRHRWITEDLGLLGIIDSGGGAAANLMAGRAAVEAQLLADLALAHA